MNKIILIQLKHCIVIIGNNALHLAVINGNLKIAELLINSGLSLLETNVYGE